MFFTVFPKQFSLQKFVTDYKRVNRKVSVHYLICITVDRLHINKVLEGWDNDFAYKTKMPCVHCYSIISYVIK